MTDETINNAAKTKMEGLTYEDYLSAVCTYDETCAQLSEAKKAYNDAANEYDKAEAELKKLEGRLSDVCAELDKLSEKEAASQKELWDKNQARYDVRLSQQKAVAQMNANTDIQNKKEKYEKAVAVAKQDIRTYKEAIAEAVRLEGKLREKQAELYDPKRKEIPHADQEAYAVLKRAKDKKLLSPQQLALISGSVKPPCKKWLNSIDSLKKMEQEFTRTEFYHEIVEGKVTDKIFTEVSNSFAMIFAALFVLISLILYAFEPNPVTTVLHSAGSSLSFGGLFASVTHVLRERYDKIKKLPVSERTILSLMFSLGAIGGAVFGAFLFAPYRGVFTLIMSVFCSAACALLFRRIMTTRIGKKYLSKIERLRDMARKDIFEKYENAEDGKYSFMVFCYICHVPIVEFLYMEHNDRERKNVSDRINSSEKDREEYKKSLDAAEKRLAALKYEKLSVDNYITKREAELEQRLREIDSGRPPEPNFKSIARVKTEKDHPELLKEKTELEKQIENAKNKVVLLEPKKRAAEERKDKLKARRQRTEQAIRDWDKTPGSSSNIYGLLDYVCIDSRSRITVINHERQPHVLYYQPKKRKKDPADTIALFIYRYIRGLCKIVPRSVMQVNIFDYISDPNILLSCRQYDNIVSKGVRKGAYSTDRFEIRLFPDKSGYSTFKVLLEDQCSKINSFVKNNKASLPSGPDIDIIDVNKAIGKDKMFRYQVCIFVVPREEDDGALPPPQSMMRIIESGYLKRFGILPVFFADCDSIADSWKPFVKKYNACPHIFSLN